MKLDDTVEDAFRLKKDQASALKRLGVLTVKDLLYHFPTRYGSNAVIKNIESTSTNEIATIYGTLSKLKTGKTFKTKNLLHLAQ